MAASFDREAGRYHRVRPRYPTALIDSLLAGTGLQAGDRVVEIGCATGVASEQLADRGLALTCVEPGPALAAEARRNLARFPAVTVVNQPFEAWATERMQQTEPVEPHDAVMAATAWHWIDRERRWSLARAVVRPHGWLAYWSAGHVFAVDGDPIFEQLQPIYDRTSAATPNDSVMHRPGRLPIDGPPEGQPFRLVDAEQFDWEIRYSAEQYIDLLCSFSGHILMAQSERDELFAEIRRLVAQRPDGLIRRHWGAVLHIARAQ